MHGVFLCEVLLMWVALGVPEASNIKNTLVEKSQILHNIFIYLDLNYTRRRREGKFILLIRQRGDKLRTTLRKIRKRTFHYYLWRFSLKHTRRQNVRVFFVFFWIFKVITSYTIYTIKFSRHYQRKWSKIHIIFIQIISNQIFIYLSFNFNLKISKVRTKFKKYFFIWINW